MAAEVGALGFLALAVIGFSGAWLDGGLVLDGPGASLWVRLALEHWENGGLPYWMPEVWSGTPAWALAPTLPVLALVPLAAAVGPETAVRLASVGGQLLGAWGAYVLARSLWRLRLPSVVAGLLYGLHPLLISHSALAGHQPAVEVMGLTPWLVWAVRKGLRGDGAQYVALAGLLAGVGVVLQPEHAYGLMLLSICVLAVELARSKVTGTGPRGPAGVVVRAGVIGLIGLGTTAYWLLPFVRMSDAFVLTPASVVRSTLLEGIGGAVGRDPGLFLTRAEGLQGVVSFDNTDFLAAGGFYLSWVCLALTLVTIAFLGRKDEDGHLTAILFASAIAVWLQTGGIPLASSGLVRSTSVLAFIAIGAVAGLLVGSFLRRLRFGRWAVVVGVATAGFLVALPYLAPFLTLQRVVPLLATVRFPRLYPIAALGLALGAAYVLVLVRPWAVLRSPSLAPLLMAALALVLASTFAFDIHPYRSFYRVHPPQALSAYARAAATMSQTGDGYRAAGSLDPRAVEPLLDAQRRAATGWPHPLASRHVWRLTAEAIFVSPPGFRSAALGLTATSHIAGERLAYPVKGTGPLIDDIDLEPNPMVLPMVRAYEQAVVVGSEDIAPELAVALAHRRIGVVTGGQEAAGALGDAARGVLASEDPCDDVAPGGPDADLGLAREVATACSIHRWVGVFTSTDFVETGRPATGARFRSSVDGLRGIGLWLDRPPGFTELTLYELAPDGVSLGDEVRRTLASGYEHNGLAAFTFAEPIADSGGKRYVFIMACPRCDEGEQAQLVVAGTERAPGDVVVEGKVDPDAVAAYSLLYDRLPPADPPTTEVLATNPRAGRWEIRTSGDRPALVVVAEAFFPGWTAEVDGRPAPVFMADGAFLGVAVGPGDHEIRLTYQRPDAALAGRAISVVSVLAGLVLLLAGLARPRRRTRSAARPEPPAPPRTPPAPPRIPPAPPRVPPAPEAGGNGDRGPRPAGAASWEPPPEAEWEPPPPEHDPAPANGQRAPIPLPPAPPPPPPPAS